MNFLGALPDFLIHLPVFRAKSFLQPNLPGQPPQIITAHGLEHQKGSSLQEQVCLWTHWYQWRYQEESHSTEVTSYDKDCVSGMSICFPVPDKMLTVWRLPQTSAVVLNKKHHSSLSKTLRRSVNPSGLRSDSYITEERTQPFQVP